MTEYARNSGIEKLGRLVFEAENYSELSGVDKTTGRWLSGCTFDKECLCMFCRDGSLMNEYWSAVNQG